MNTSAKFSEIMERYFGTEEAFGMYFQLETEGPHISLIEHAEMIARLGDSMPATVSYLRNGGSATCCTNYAELIYKAGSMETQIFGFANANNPTSRIARDEIHPAGHDFAIVRKRFIVDPWPRLVPQAFDQMVFDLEDPIDAAFVLDVYGPRECWTRNFKAEHSAG